MSSGRVEYIFRLWQELTLEEARMLNEAIANFLRDEPSGGIGVREPRRPLPEGPERRIFAEDGA